MNIQIINHSDGFSCQDEALIILLTWLRKEYILIYGKSWFFYYDCHGIDKVLSNKMAHDVRQSIDLNLMKKYYGVSMAEIKKECDKDFVSNIKFQLNLGHPVMILLKDTDCTWINKKSNPEAAVEHSIIINDYNKTEDSFICTDSFYSKNNIVLPNLNLEKSLIAYYTYDLVEYDKNYKWDSILTNLIMNYIKINSIYNLRMFYEELRYYNIQTEIEEKGSYEQTQFYLWFDRYRMNRKKLELILSEAQRNCIDLEIKDTIEYSKSNYIIWCNIHRLFLKMAFMSGSSTDKIKNNIFEYLKQIITMEEKILESMNRFI